MGFFLCNHVLIIDVSQELLTEDFLHVRHFRENVIARFLFHWLACTIIDCNLYEVVWTFDGPMMLKRPFMTFVWVKKGNEIKIDVIVK